MAMDPHPPVPPHASLQLLARAPHRLLFFVGAVNLLAAMLWWTAWLAAARWPEVVTLRQPQPYAGWLHAFVMQYQMLPSFIFGFLLTVFPKWMGLPAFRRWRYLVVGTGMLGGQVATLLGALGWQSGLLPGVALTLIGWAAALATLAPLLWRESGVTWHARSCVAALLAGFIGLLAWAAFLLGAAPHWAWASIQLGSFGLLLPVYFTVAHRMVPFFSAGVVPGYVVWKPLWVLAVFWALTLAHLGLALVRADAWLWLPDLALCALTLLLCWRWWPRGAMPGLLRALFLGLAWLPVSFALYAGQSLALLWTGRHWLGRAPAHALFIGVFASVLIAMVTRVSQGHSGRPLRMPIVAWLAFAAIQGVALARIAAELAGDPMAWHLAASIGWLAAFTPWVAWLARIHLTPRIDGKPG